jgi:enterochelin esterase-like enzyme
VEGHVVAEAVGGRGVTVYVPPATPEAVVFAGDGQVVAPWGSTLEDCGLPPTMLVGAHGLADEVQRLHEYSPVFDADRFSTHEAFFVDELGAWTSSRFGVDLPPERTAVLGFSAAGELALAMGLRHPDRYGAVLCGSPGAGYRPPVPLPATMPRTYLVAGTEEPFFLANASRWADALGQAGIEVVMAERAGGHGDPFWREELPAMVGWAFR